MGLLSIVIVGLLLWIALLGVIVAVCAAASSADRRDVRLHTRRMRARVQRAPGTGFVPRSMPFTAARQSHTEAGAPTSPHALTPH